MNKTKIEWCDITWNPIKGYCPNNCEYCYAHRLYNRFGWDKTLRLDEKELFAITFVGSMIDMYHPTIDRNWVKKIIRHTEWLQKHTFITLTKFPLRLLLYNFPSWWWTGVTVTGMEWWDALVPDFYCMDNIKFISFKPLLKPIKKSMIESDLDWIIIGGLTPRPVHKKEWIDDIVRRADNLHIPVFIKNNAHYDKIIQEFPE